MKSKEDQFDKKVAVRCAQAFAGATGIGCTVSDAAGTPLFESGYGCASCRLCAAMGQPGEQCARVHTYGMVEAERFGGQYIYFCPQGLNFFVSPILGSHGSAARITAGPFIMVDRQDFLACEVAERPGTDLQAVYPVLEHIPYVEPSRVTQLSTLLFMAVGFMNNVAAENRMLSAGRSDALQSQISNYIVQLKEAEEPPPYPFELERRLLQSISRQEKGDAQQYLNGLLGAILFSAGGIWTPSRAVLPSCWCLSPARRWTAGLTQSRPCGSTTAISRPCPSCGRWMSCATGCRGWSTGIWTASLSSPRPATPT